MLTVLNHLPAGLLSLQASQLYTLLKGPTLIHLEGRREAPLFISVLQHGNEHTGWEAVRRLLAAYENKTLPRAVSLFIGNVAAARHGQRFLEGQEDFNRGWGTSVGPPQPLMQRVIDEMQARDVYLSVDVHNNTGKNPHYACVNRTDWQFLHLARLFSRTVVYFIRPEGVQSMAFAGLCPAVTIECGLSGEQSGTQHVHEYLDACLHLSNLPARPIAARDLDLYHTVATVKVPPQLSLGFADPSVDVSLDEGIEFYNFRELPANTAIGTVAAGIETPLAIGNEAGKAIEDDYITLTNGQIFLKKACIPAMITRDVSVIKKDCLCYLMEHYPLPGAD